MADLIVCVGGGPHTGIPADVLLKWARALDPDAHEVLVAGRVTAIRFQHPDVTDDRRMHRIVEVRILNEQALAVDGAWPEVMDVPRFLRTVVPSDVSVVMFDDGGNWWIDAPEGASREDLADLWQRVARD